MQIFTSRSSLLRSSTRNILFAVSSCFIILVILNKDLTIQKSEISNPVLFNSQNLVKSCPIKTAQVSTTTDLIQAQNSKKQVYNNKNSQGFKPDSYLVDIDHTSLPHSNEWLSHTQDIDTTQPSLNLNFKIQTLV